VALWVASVVVLGCGGGSSQGGAGGGVAAGGQAGASSTGGHAGASSASGGAAAGGAGGGPPCAPCFTTIVNRVNCDPSPTATCVEQTSQTTNAEGTITKVDNKCYSDGTKSLQHQSIGPIDAGIDGTESVLVQIFKNGAACASGEISITGTVENEKVTELLRDGAGNLLATLVYTVMRPDGGDAVETQTITCAGQAPQPLGACPSSGSPVSCTPGTCM
jgi:hypothetical protein